MTLRSLTGRGNGSLALGVLRVRPLVSYQDVQENSQSRQWLSGLTVDDLTGKSGRVIPARGEGGVSYGSCIHHACERGLDHHRLADGKIDRLSGQRRLGCRRADRTANP